MKSEIKYVCLFFKNCLLTWNLDQIKIDWGCWNPAQHLLGERQEYTLHRSCAAWTLTLMWPLEMMFSSNDVGLQLNVWVVSMASPIYTPAGKFPRRATNNQKQWIQIIVISSVWIADAWCILHGEKQKFIPMDGCLLAINSWFYLFFFFLLEREWSEKLVTQLAEGSKTQILWHVGAAFTYAKTQWIICW